MRSGKSCDFLASHNSKKLTLHCIIGFKNNFTKKSPENHAISKASFYEKL
jgi:hypothetical protein